MLSFRSFSGISETASCPVTAEARLCQSVRVSVCLSVCPSASRICVGSQLRCVLRSTSKCSCCIRIVTWRVCSPVNRCTPIQLINTVRPLSHHVCTVTRTRNGRGFNTSGLPLDPSKGLSLCALSVPFLIPLSVRNISLITALVSIHNYGHRQRTRPSYQVDQGSCTYPQGRSSSYESRRGHSYQLSHAYDRFLDATADRRIKTRKNWVPASSDEDLVMRSKRQNKV